MAAVLPASLAKSDDSVVLREITHLDTCRAAASTTSEARAVRDTYLIGTGVTEGVTGSDRFSE